MYFKRKVGEKMLGKSELGQIKQKERAAFRREWSAWMEYLGVKRRFEDAYDALLSAWEDFENVEEEPERGYDAEIRLILARKRHRSAQEEFQYQRMERERVMEEFELARLERRHWCERVRQKVMEMDKMSVCG